VLRWFQSQLPPDGEIDAASLDAIVKGGMAELGLKGKAYYTPLRLALIHQQHGPDLPTTFAILGLEEVHRRLAAAIRD
jgi:glutamyl/glutaminyl-tRNA synthetase